MGSVSENKDRYPTFCPFLLSSYCKMQIENKIEKREMERWGQFDRDLK